ncbi:hypothetical protein GJ496_007679 [Pomphorhynchus laevis]|nr:hypothetical protein GJ496_007679 [Pomphorhynchus laevis]
MEKGALASHEQSSQIRIIHTFDKYVQFCCTLYETKFKIFQALLAATHTNIADIPLDFETNVKKEVDIQINKLLDQLMYVKSDNNPMDSALHRILESVAADDSSDDLKPPPYQALFHMPEWCFYRNQAN